ncbi:MAG: hypothetical protein QNL88_10480 [Acidobacteriota bacterium]|nr:hypothetical protein [Acidobacteriota bacterium]
MRISGGFVVTALLAAGFALYLTGRDAGSSLDAVAKVSEELREPDVPGQALDPETALRMVTVMEGLVDAPEAIGDYGEDLRLMADTAASWAAAAPTASRELHIAVSLRSAAGDLRAYALRPSQSYLMRARRRLDQAQSSLDGMLNSTATQQPHLATDGLRDQLQNLEQAHREQQLEVDKELRR